MPVLRKLTRRLAGVAATAAAACVPTTPPSAPREVPSIVAPSLDRPVVEELAQGGEPRDPVSQAVFARINEDRVANGLAVVAWDEAAAQVAARFCRRQVEEKTRGHFLTDGLPPYARMSFSAVFGMNAENSVSWVTTGDRFAEPAVELALEGHFQMMEERPPDDGHRRTILDPESTHVGVGWHMAAGRFQLSEEFLTRRLERLSLERAGPQGDVVRIRGRSQRGWRVLFATAAHEPRRTLTREEASGRTFYAFPNPEAAYVPEGAASVLRISGAPAHDRLRLLSEREFTLLFAPERPGLWTLVFYFGSRSSIGPSPGASVTLEAR